MESSASHDLPSELSEVFKWSGLKEIWTYENDWQVVDYNEIGAKHLSEGMKDRPNLFDFFS